MRSVHTRMGGRTVGIRSGPGGHHHRRNHLLAPRSTTISQSSSSPRRSFWTLSFSGAGHLMPYHLGVAKTFLEERRDDRNTEPREDRAGGTAVSNPAGPNDASRSSSSQQVLPIRSVSGSSSGAIAATVMTRMPHRLEEYTERFLQDRGHAFRNLREMLLSSSERDGSGTTEGGGFANPDAFFRDNNGPVLSICTTRCSDGGIELFSFGGGVGGGGDGNANGLGKGISDDDAITGDETEESNHRGDGNSSSDRETYERRKQQQQRLDRLLKAVEASCRIPRSFHPVDMVALNHGSWLNGIGERVVVPGTSLGGVRDTYPREEGVVIDGKGYADGGIAAPFPPTLLDGHPECTGRIVVSPVTGEYFYETTTTATTASDHRRPRLEAIRPESDASWRVPFIGSVTLGGSGRMADAPSVAVRAVPNLQNLRVLAAALGVVSSSSGPTSRGNDGGGPSTGGGGGGVLRDWYERGQADAHELLHRLSSSPSP